jgi:hypothetical protein
MTRFTISIQVIINDRPKTVKSISDNFDLIGDARNAAMVELKEFRENNLHITEHYIMASISMKEFV